MTQLADCGHGGQSAGDEVGRATPISSVGGLRLEELRVGQHDSELVVQAVEEHCQLVVAGRLIGLKADGREPHALGVGPGRSRPRLSLTL